MIQFEKCGMQISYPIAKINCIAIDYMKETVFLGLDGTCDELNDILFTSQEEAEKFYFDCVAKVEKFYNKSPAIKIVGPASII